jgi:8-oxo-dGTP pyrophosphatase MutT (NUDIX family)
MTLDKVTAFVTRSGDFGVELLLFRHPNEGIQLPAGTVEEGEAPAAAVIREVYVEFQQRWLDYVMGELGYRFG